MSWYEYGTSRIYYEEEGRGDPLLLIPGLTLSIEDMQAVRQALTPKYHVIAADAPGSGRSGPQPRRYPATYYHDDARMFLSLLSDLRAAPAHVVGFSDGGEYAVVMAETKPAAVRSIAVWGAAGIAPPLEMVDVFLSVVDNPIPPMKEFSDYLKSTYGEQNARATVQSVGEAWRAMRNAGGDISHQRAPEIACPALLIAGEHDPLAPSAAIATLARAIPQGEFVEIKGASHLIHHEQPDLLIKTIVDWLAQR
jgi:valacyclovir hydrolase